MKQCTKCGAEKPPSEFHKHKITKDGLSHVCKECARERQRAFSKTPSGFYTSIIARQKFRKTHPKRWGNWNPVSISREKFIEWYENEPKMCAYCDLTLDELGRLNDSQNNKINRFTVDRKNNYRGYERGNLVLACLRCNYMKSDIFDHDTMREIGMNYIRPIWDNLLRDTMTMDKARDIRENIIERDRELLEKLNTGSKKVRPSLRQVRGMTMKYSIMYHGDSYQSYDTLEELLADEWMFKNIYGMGACYIYKSADLTEEEEKIVDARSWEVQEWGYLPDPRGSKPSRINTISTDDEKTNK